MSRFVQKCRQDQFQEINRHAMLFVPQNYCFDKLLLLLLLSLLLLLLPLLIIINLNFIARTWRNQ